MEFVAGSCDESALQREGQSKWANGSRSDEELHNTRDQPTYRRGQNQRVEDEAFSVRRRLCVCGAHESGTVVKTNQNVGKARRDGHRERLASAICSPIRLVTRRTMASSDGLAQSATRALAVRERLGMGRRQKVSSRSKGSPERSPGSAPPPITRRGRPIEAASADADGRCGLGCRRSRVRGRACSSSISNGSTIWSWAPASSPSILSATVPHDAQQDGLMMP